MKQGFESVNSILGKVVKSLGIDRGLREITLKNLWPEVVGNKFKGNSKLVSILNKQGHDILFVAVKSSTVAQELIFHKTNIIKKYEKVAKKLEFNIVDIVFSPKNWEEKNEAVMQQEGITDIFLINPTDSDLKEITVPESIIELVKESVSSQNFSSPELKDRMLHTIIKDIKTQIWQKNQGFPVCSNCGIPVNYHSNTEKILCPSCKYI